MSKCHVALWRSASSLPSDYKWNSGYFSDGRLYLHVANQPDQLSLAVPSWVGAVSTTASWEK